MLLLGFPNQVWRLTKKLISLKYLATGRLWEQSLSVGYTQKLYSANAALFLSLQCSGVLVLATKL